MQRPQSRVYLIETDPAVLDAVALVLRQHDFEVKTFASSDQFLASSDLDGAACVISEARSGAIAGPPELLACLRERGIGWPVIVMGTEGSSDAVWAQAGIFCFLSKPFGGHTLVRWVERAVLSMTNP